MSTSTKSLISWQNETMDLSKCCWRERKKNDKWYCVCHTPYIYCHWPPSFRLSIIGWEMEFQQKLQTLLTPTTNHQSILDDSIFDFKIFGKSMTEEKDIRRWCRRGVGSPRPKDQHLHTLDLFADFLNPCSLHNLRSINLWKRTCLLSFTGTSCEPRHIVHSVS